MRSELMKSPLTMISPAESKDLLALVKSQLEYPRGVLLLLKDTSLFGEPIQKALDELDMLVGELESRETLIKGSVLDI